ncbi:hypothetical protein F3Y22_tig00007361pilonHSYRG00009 [Hibiscus syriacus]|uniref:Anaphase-promoting complex subunit 1 n=1 Tax=Hibiscus syriacus TaxID=106335 RepID=A0A6A3CFM4_HIBSY|nr:hypothetical protein F3Y22_tig00007361pilonHSYRG00009 [Hibiscus syriacus]
MAAYSVFSAIQQQIEDLSKLVKQDQYLETRIAMNKDRLEHILQLLTGKECEQKHDDSQVFDKLPTSKIQITASSRGSGKHSQLIPSTPKWAVVNGVGVILSVCDEEVAHYETASLTAAAVPALLVPPPTTALDEHPVAGLPALEPYARLFHRYYYIAIPRATQRLLLGLLEAPPWWATDAIDAIVQFLELLQAAEDYTTGIRLPRNWMLLHFLRAIGTAMSIRAGIAAVTAAALFFRILSQPALFFPPIRQVDGVEVQHDPSGGSISCFRKKIEVPAAEATIYTLLTEAFTVPKLVLAGQLPAQQNATINLDPSMRNIQELKSWPEFHNVVAAGLRLAPLQEKVSRTWIIYNKPEEPNALHAGLLLALGLHEFLRVLRITDIYQYFSQEHESTTAGLMLGLATSYRGTMQPSIAKCLYVHIPAHHPSSYPELELPTLLQTAALISLGLLFEGSTHPQTMQRLLSEIGRRSGGDNVLEREGYVVSAGFSLGLVALGRGEDTLGFMDTLVDWLFHYSGGKEIRNERFPLLSTSMDEHNRGTGQMMDGTSVNVDVTAPGAMIALALMIHPTKDWIQSQIPEIVENGVNSLGDDTMDIDEMDAETTVQAYVNIVAGACISLGLRFAGTKDGNAQELLYEYDVYFLNEIKLVSTTNRNDPFHSGILHVKRKVESCSYVDDPLGCQSLLSRAMHKVFNSTSQIAVNDGPTAVTVDQLVIPFSSDPSLIVFAQLFCDLSWNSKSDVDFQVFCLQVLFECISKDRPALLQVYLSLYTTIGTLAEQVSSSDILVGDSLSLSSLKFALSYNEVVLTGRLTTSNGSIFQSVFLGSFQGKGNVITIWEVNKESSRNQLLKQQLLNLKIFQKTQARLAARVYGTYIVLQHGVNYIELKAQLLGFDPWGQGSFHGRGIVMIMRDSLIGEDGGELGKLEIGLGISIKGRSVASSEGSHANNTNNTCKGI